MQTFRSGAATLAAIALLTIIVAGVSQADAPADATPSWINPQTNVQYTQNGVPEYMDIYSPANVTGAKPVIVAIHGGGWSGGQRHDFSSAAPLFVKEGYIFCTIDYRLDSIAPYPAQIEDCKCAIRFLRANAAQYHVNSNLIGVWGASAGGHLVALLGTTANVKRLEGTGGWQNQSSAVNAVLDWFGPTDLRPELDATYHVQAGRDMVEHLLGGSPADNPALARDASPVTFVAPGDPPFLIMHGDQDPLVPVSQSQELYDALKAAGDKATLHIVLGAAHGGPQFMTPANIALIDGFFNGILNPANKSASAN